MKLTNRQAHLMFTILLESLKIADENKCFFINREARRELADDILKQQEKNVKIIKETRYTKIQIEEDKNAQ